MLDVSNQCDCEGIYGESVGLGLIGVYYAL